MPANAYGPSRMESFIKSEPLEILLSVLRTASVGGRFFSPKANHFAGSRAEGTTIYSAEICPHIAYHSVLAAHRTWYRPFQRRPIFRTVKSQNWAGFVRAFGSSSTSARTKVNLFSLEKSDNMQRLWHRFVGLASRLLNSIPTTN
jgi:hypothetical protein